MSSRRQLEDDVVRISHRLHANGWVANHDGNVSAKLPDGRIVATPTAVSKADVRRDWLIIVNDEGEKLSGTRNSFSEMALHLAVYRHRPDAQAVVHSHSPYATALAVAGTEVCPRMMPEPVVSLGPRIPLVPYAAPKSPGFAAGLLPFLDQSDALTLEHHGVLSWGPDLEHAYLRMELVEHLARIQILVQGATGGQLRTLADGELGPLLDARRRAGLGPEGRQR